MWSEMSQYMPSTAVSSEIPSSIDGTDAQAGRPLRPARETSQALQPAAAMARDQVGHERRRNEGASRGTDGLAERGSARGLLAGGLRERGSGAHQHNTENASKGNRRSAHVLSSSGR